jgi:hypothetical protein
LIGEYSKKEEVTKNTTKNEKSKESDSILSISGSLDLDNFEIEDELDKS